MVLQHEIQFKAYALNFNIGMNSFMPGNTNTVNFDAKRDGQVRGNVNTQQVHANALQGGNKGFRMFKR